MREEEQVQPEEKIDKINLTANRKYDGELRATTHRGNRTLTTEPFRLRLDIVCCMHIQSPSSKPLTNVNVHMATATVNKDSSEFWAKAEEELYIEALNLDGEDKIK